MLRSAARAVGRRARVAGSCVAFHELRAAPSLASRPPPTPPRRRRAAAAAAHPPRRPWGASAPVCPQGRPGGKKPQPGQAERESSGWAGSSCQGQALRLARKRHARQP